MKAIETRWKGYRFRSRLEARWAVFFNTLGLKWEYEPEGFELKSGLYLPDFRIEYPGRWTNEIHYNWFEVKGDIRSINVSEWTRILEFDQSAGIVILDGTPEPRMYRTPREWVDAEKLSHGIIDICSDCLEYDRSGVALLCSRGRMWWDMHDIFFSGKYGFEEDALLLTSASMAAKSARFEHGESP